MGVIASFPPARECKRDEVALTKGDERTILRVGEAVAKKTQHRAFHNRCTMPQPEDPGNNMQAFPNSHAHFHTPRPKRGLQQHHEGEEAEDIRHEGKNYQA